MHSRAMAKLLTLALALSCTILSGHVSALQTDSDGFIVGRATYWESEYKQGNCQFGGNIPSNNYLGAFPDVQEGFTGSCGKCFLVACRAATVKDGYGASIDRSKSCIDTTKGVVIKITDACPCNYQNNAYSNSRWCCGDNDLGHIDISKEAFTQLASAGQGVIGIRYKEVDCGSNYGVKSITPSTSSPAALAPAPASAPAASSPSSSPASPRKQESKSNTTPSQSSSGGWGSWQDAISNLMSKWGF